MSKIEENIDLTNQQHQHLLDSLVNEHHKTIKNYHNLLDSLPLGSPLDTLAVSSDYGWRRKPLGVGWQMHSGIDYLAAWHDTVYATGSGVVSKAKWNSGYGRCVILEHVGGYQSCYAHLYKYFVNPGDNVEKGQPIGRAGNSGPVTGPHLHYEVRRNSISTNPSQYILDL